MRNNIIGSFVFLVVVIFVFSSLTPENNNSYRLPPDDYIYDFVEEMPEFPGGELGLEKYIVDNLNYPKRIKKAGISGVVYSECVIEKNGEVTNEKVYPGISKKLESEALKLIKKMPNWIPGKNKTKLVRVKLSIPIEFK